MPNCFPELAVPFCIPTGNEHAPMAPQARQHLGLPVFWILAIVICVYWYFIVVLICSSLVIYHVEHLLFLNCFIFGCTGFSLSPVGFLQLLWSGSSLRWLLFLHSMDSRVHELSSCGTWAYLPRGMWDIPGPGIKLVSPAPQGGFLTTGSPGRPPSIFS